MPNRLYVPKILGLTQNFCVSYEKDGLSYIIKSALKSKITLWNLNDLRPKKSIPAWEGYDEVDNLF